MGTLIENPRREVFSHIPLLEDALQEFKEKNALKLIENVGQIFVKYNVWNKFGLSMAHRHFEMSESEILVESMKRDKSLSVFVPWEVFPGKNAEPVDTALMASYGLEKPTGTYVLPQNWAFGLSGNVIPFEYLATSDMTLLSSPSAKFVGELYAALKALGVERIIGLRNIEQKGDINTWETTPENVRANVVVHGEMPADMTPENMVKVLWTFDENGKIQEGKAGCFACWCSHCGSHCGNCTHRQPEK